MRDYHILGACGRALNDIERRHHRCCDPSHARFRRASNDAIYRLLAPWNADVGLDAVYDLPGCDCLRGLRVCDLRNREPARSEQETAARRAVVACLNDSGTMEHSVTSLRICLIKR